MEKNTIDRSQIDDHVTIGTNACCKTHFDETLLSENITIDISLQEERLDAAQGAEAFLWLPTVDHTPPTLAQANLGIAFIDQAIAEGKKMYIHCKNGHGRAPTLYASYLVKKKGMTAEAAVALIKEKRPSIHLQDSQLEFLKSLEQSN